MLMLIVYVSLAPSDVCFLSAHQIRAVVTIAVVCPHGEYEASRAGSKNPLQ
jgi:hypothetical protein